MPILLLPFFLLIVPVLEITVFIVVGGQIGIFPTLGMVLVTAVIGSILLRMQGFQLLSEIRAKTDAGEVPGRALVHGVMLLIAGVLLLTPGFVTDTIGFLLFVPAIRDAIWQFLKARIKIDVIQPGHAEPGGKNPTGGPTIDLEETEFGPVDPNTPWKEK